MSSVVDDVSLRTIRPLRFVHASDLHLERTLEGVIEAPAHWEQRMLNVSRRTAERLFQHCISENVDFLLLSGNVLNIHAAPPGLLIFLLEQFERLKKAGIAVYWAGGEFDSPNDWITGFSLPENVHHFPDNSIQEYYFHRDEGSGSLPIAKIMGMSRNQHRRRIRASEFPLGQDGLFTIAAVNGEAEPETLAQRSVDYWAMGGSNRRHTFYGNPRKKGPDGKPLLVEHSEPAGTRRDKKELPPQPFIVHYPGATLARTPHDTGLYGGTLVEVPLDEEAKMVDEPILTSFSLSPIRWVNDRITLEATDDGGNLADILRQRIKNYRDAQKTDDLMINWQIDVPPGHLAVSLRRGGLAADLLSELRALYGQSEPMTWSVSISVVVPEQLPKAAYEQQTILGDFLRSVKHFQDNPAEILHLEGYIPKNWEHEEEGKHLLLAERVKDEITNSDDKEPKEHWVQTPQQTESQQRILREAAMTGAEVFALRESVTAAT